MTREPSWIDHEVRLFPSVHISGEREAELRATASLLAAIKAVSEFGKVILRASGGSAGRLSCYTEAPFDLHLADGQAPENVRPDGVLISERGKTSWLALVEVKVGNSTLEQEQLDRYHRLAKQVGAGVLITVSNQPARADGTPPLNIDRRRNIPVVHFSWERLLSEAQVLSRKKGVSDPDQKWMLDEWIRYVDDPASRIIVPPDLGPSWPDVLKDARTSALSWNDPKLQDVARHWVGFLRRAALKLRAKLGVDVAVRMSKKERDDAELHAQTCVIDREGILTGTLRIPDAAGDVSLKAILPSQSVQYILRITAPTEGRQATRINWLARQLRRDLPAGELVVVADWNVRGLTTSAPAKDFAEDSTRLSIDIAGVQVPRDAAPRFFEIVWTRNLAKGRGRSSAPILASISAGLEEFYLGVVQDLVPFVPRAPRLAPDTEPDRSHGETKTPPVPAADQPSARQTQPQEQ